MKEKKKMNYDIEKFKRIKKEYMNIKIKEENHLVENYKKFFEFLDEIESKLKNEFLKDYKLKIELYFNKEDFNDSNQYLYNITCLYIFYDPIDDKTFKYKDDNILCNGTNSNSQGFTFLIEDINHEKYKSLQYKNDKPNNNQEIQMNDITKIKNKNNKKLIIPSVIFVDDSKRSQTFILEKKSRLYQNIKAN